jgi:hypothetical protein
MDGAKRRKAAKPARSGTKRREAGAKPARSRREAGAKPREAARSWREAAKHTGRL